MSMNEDDYVVAPSKDNQIDYLNKMCKSNWNRSEYYRREYTKYYWEYYYLTKKIIPYIITILLKEKSEMLVYNGKIFDLNDIKNKEDYLELVNTWKETYKELSKNIRTLKRTRKTFSWKRVNSKTEKSKVKIGNNPDYDSRANSKLEVLSYYATRLLEFRELLKQQGKSSKKKALAV